MIGYMNEKKKYLVVTFLLCTVTALAGIIGNRLNGLAVDNYIVTGNLKGLLTIYMILVSLYLVSVVSTYIQNRLMVRIAQSTSSDIRMDLYRNIHMLPIKYFDMHSRGDLMSRLTNDVDNINMTLLQNITQLFSGVVNIVGMLIAMAILCTPLLFVGLLTLPLMFLLTKVSRWYYRIHLYSWKVSAKI